MGNNTFGIDLGTSNIKIYNKATDTVTVEKNLIAVENKTTLLAYGDTAYDMYEKAPSNIKISYPLSNGVIADIEHMKSLVKLFITDQMKGASKPVDVYIAVPKDVTEVERRAFHDLIKESGVKAKKIMMVKKPVADGLGMGVDVMNSQGVLVVNVGYDTTEISILSLKGIVISKLIKVGGKKFDDAIRNVIRKEFSLIIGEKTSENIKISLKELEKSGQDAVVYGRDIVTGLPVERSIPTDLIDQSLIESFDQILDNIKATLERTPPELAADIFKHGLYLTGGASQVCHLAQRLSNGVGLNVNLAENPLSSVALGLGKIIKDDQYKALAYSVEEDV
ncbi:MULTISPECIES: rod shape-determining protein [unclassified Butyrivibrio]|uniref:rod shape-determining protein n=1 Tax=unclassified Butyrivibrio TaxID=2639466 RepID=UPI0004147E81|nr:MULTISPECIES: rod shape-determining protein [unclassified Butyrivibrio]MCR5344351.1 rod shape-determining protein [Butyrivibrio sp.]